MGERFHGIPARLTSPKIAHTGYFISKHVRNAEDIHPKLQNLLVITKTIYEKIEAVRFNIIEVMYGYQYRFDQIQRWYIDIEVNFGFKVQESMNLMVSDLDKTFGTNKGFLSSVTNEQNATDILGIRTLGSAPHEKMDTDLKQPDFSDSDDSDFLAAATAATQANDKKGSGSKSNSGPLFGSQSKSSTRDIRDSIERFVNEWVEEPTDSDSNLKNSENSSANSTKSGNSRCKDVMDNINQASSKLSSIQLNRNKTPTVKNTTKLPKPHIGKAIKPTRLNFKRNPSDDEIENEPIKKKRTRTSSKTPNRKK